MLDLESAGPLQSLNHQIPEPSRNVRPQHPTKLLSIVPPVVYLLSRAFQGS